MPNRWAIVMVVAGVLIGYSIRDKKVDAQERVPFPFVVGDTVTLGFAQHAAQPAFGSSIECPIAEIRGEYVRCGSRTLTGGLNPSERWISMEYVVQVIKRER
jgi:hypothetical protein